MPPRHRAFHSETISSFSCLAEVYLVTTPPPYRKVQRCESSFIYKIEVVGRAESAEEILNNEWVPLLASYVQGSHPLAGNYDE